MADNLREILARFAYTDPINFSDGDIDQAESEILAMLPEKKYDGGQLINCHREWNACLDEVRKRLGGGE